MPSNVPASATVNDFAAQFRIVESKFATVDLHKVFPTKIADMLIRVADSFNVPHAFMISVVITLVSAFSHAVYVEGPGSMFESLIFMILEIAPPGSNKSGAAQLVFDTLRHVLTALEVIDKDFETCKKNNFRICKQSLPELDRSATVAAGVRAQARNPSLVRIEDEYLNYDRMLNYCGGNGIGSALTAFNGEAQTSYDLSNEKVRAVIPRRQLLAFCQPQVFEAKVAAASSQIGNGFVSRLSISVGAPNLLRTAELFRLEDGDVSLSELIMAIASLGVVEFGTLTELEGEELATVVQQISDKDDADPMTDDT